MIVNSNQDVELPVAVSRKVTFIGSIAQSTKTKPLEEVPLYSSMMHLTVPIAAVQVVRSESEESCSCLIRLCS